MKPFHFKNGENIFGRKFLKNGGRRNTGSFNEKVSNYYYLKFSS